jgi:hypothetical protein
LRYSLFSFKAITAGTAFRVATASVANVDFAERAIVARTVVFAFGYTATDARVYFLSFFHHNVFLL